MYNRPNEAEVQKVMREMGMDYLQAYRHVKQREELRARRERNPYPLGKSAVLA